MHELNDMNNNRKKLIELIYEMHYNELCNYQKVINKNRRIL